MEESSRAANFFASLGIGKGDKVLLILRRHLQFWPILMALHKLGAVAVPATHLLTEKDIQYRVNAAGIKAAVITHRNPQLLEAALHAQSRMRNAANADRLERRARRLPQLRRGNAAVPRGV